MASGYYIAPCRLENVDIFAEVVLDFGCLLCSRLVVNFAVLFYYILQTEALQKLKVKLRGSGKGGVRPAAGNKE